MTVVRVASTNTPVRPGNGGDAVTFLGKPLSRTAPSDNDVWGYDLATESWIPGPPTSGLGVGDSPTITGLWSFANAGGLKTDVIAELTPAAGVTIDGLLIKDAGIPEAAVTAHEAALSITGAQIVSLVEADVTAHEAALSIAGSQLSDLSAFALLADAEAVTGLWDFTNAGGFKTDVIAESSVGVGVTVDGVLLKDGGAKITGQIELPNGTASNPALFASTDPDTGIYFVGNHVIFASSSVGGAGFNNQGLEITKDAFVSWSVDSNVYGVKDIELYRDAAGVLAQRVSTAAQEQRIYGTWTNSTNYERLAFITAAGDHAIKPEAAGTGTLRGLTLGASGGKLGFYETTAVTKPDVSGSRGGNAALADLLTELASLGLITDSST